MGGLVVWAKALRTPNGELRSTTNPIGAESPARRILHGGSSLYQWEEDVAGNNFKSWYPVFGIRSYAEAIDYYVDWLGFNLDWE